MESHFRFVWKVITQGGSQCGIVRFLHICNIQDGLK